VFTDIPSKVVLYRPFSVTFNVINRKSKTIQPSISVLNKLSEITLMGNCEQVSVSYSSHHSQAFKQLKSGVINSFLSFYFVVVVVFVCLAIRNNPTKRVHQHYAFFSSNQSRDSKTPYIENQGYSR
jgi:hypothetical protein